jgi:hypothetical protein
MPRSMVMRRWPGRRRRQHDDALLAPGPLFWDLCASRCDELVSEILGALALQAPTSWQ